MSTPLPPSLPFSPRTGRTVRWKVEVLSKTIPRQTPSVPGVERPTPDTRHRSRGVVGAKD